ncbi:uncharacterized protein LOC129583829 [Paramacrobiotus metropolitanus]|uniref:uncharacterized protein LOC129583829 n=1 Tax=Paramacrobiotus metropolitanus TaxID=2943436 RepID=UPI00244625FF|nr:uncharacterized protein LOC129583829 [Paramacrobiotus metropolitanus]
MSARAVPRPVKFKVPPTAKDAANAFSLLSTPAAVNSVYYALLIWLAFIITCLALILPQIIKQRHFWIVLELLSARRWFDVAYNALQARPLAAEDKATIKTGDTAQPVTAHPVLFHRLLAKLGFIQNPAPYTMPAAAESSMLNFYGDTGLVQPGAENEKEKFGLGKDEQSSSRYLWYLMERPDIHDQPSDNPFMQLQTSSLTAPSKSEPTFDFNLASRFEESKQDIDTGEGERGAEEIHLPESKIINQVCRSGTCQYHSSLDPSKLSDPKYFSAGVERLIKEMLEDVALAAVEDNFESDAEVEKETPVPLIEDLLVIPKLLVENLAEPILSLASAIGAESPLVEPVTVPEVPRLSIADQFSSTGVSEPLAVSSVQDTMATDMHASEILVRPSQQRLPQYPDAVVFPCDIDLTRPNGWRFAQWKPCEIRVGTAEIAVRYRNRKDQLVEKHITEKDPSQFTFSVPRSMKTGLSASARRFGLICPNGHFRFRALDHESQAKILLALRNFTKPITV